MKRNDASNATDTHLLARFEQGRDQSAFAEIVSRHGPMVLATTMRKLRSKEDAEDAFQATFFALAKAADRLRSGEVLAAWLHSTALRSSSSMRRGLGRRHRFVKRLMDQSDERKVELDTKNANPLETIANDEAFEILDEEISKLPTKLQAAIVLCHLEGLSQEQAAKRLDIPASTVHDHLTKGRQVLKSKLVRRGVILTLACLLTYVASSSKTSAAISFSLIADTTAKSVLYAAGRSASEIGVSNLVFNEATKVITTMTTTKIASLFLAALAIVTLAAPVATIVGMNGFGAVRAGTILSDDFEGSFDGAWRIVSGNGDLEIVDGRMTVTPSDRNAIVIQPFRADGTAFRLEDANVHARFNIPDGSQAQIGLLVRGDEYSAAVDTENAAGLFQGSNFNEVDADNNLAFDIGGQDIDLQLNAIGADVSFSVWPTQDPSNRVILNGDDAEPTSGRFAIYIRAFGGRLEAVQIDDVVVVPEPSSSSIAAVLFFALALAAPTLRTRR